MEKGDTPAGVAGDIDAQHHANPPSKRQHHVSAPSGLSTGGISSPALPANLPPRNRLIRPIPVPSRRARFSGAEQHLRNAAIAKHHHDERPEEFGKELPQREARLAPE